MANVTDVNLEEDDPIINNMHSIANTWIEREGSFTLSSLVPFVTHLMQSVQKIAKGKGAYKKQVILTVLRKIVAAKVEAGQQEMFTNCINTMVPPMIDTMVLASSTNLFGKNSLFKRCCPCFC